MFAPQLRSLVLACALVLWAWPVHAAWALVESGNFNTLTAAGATIPVTPVSNTPIGSVVVIYCSAATTGAAVSGFTTAMTVSDAVGNGSYARLNERTQNNAATDFIGGIFYKQLTVALLSTDQITCNTGNAASEGKAIDISVFSVAAGSTVTAVSSEQSGGTGTAYNQAGGVTGLSNISRLWLGMVFVGHNSGSITCDATFTCVSSRVANTGTALTSQIETKAHKLNSTSTGDEFDGTISASRVWGAFVAALEEVPAGGGTTCGEGLLTGVQRCR